MKQGSHRTMAQHVQHRLVRHTPPPYPLVSGGVSLIRWGTLTVVGWGWPRWSGLP